MSLAVGGASLLQRHLRHPQQRLIVTLHVHFVGVRIRRCDHRAVAAEDERRTGLSYRQLRQELRQARVFDDDGEHTLAFLIDVDRAGISDRRTQTDRKRTYLEPARLVFDNALLVPFLIGDLVIGVFEPALLKFDVADNDTIFVDAAFDDAVDLADFHHLKAKIAELVRGEKRVVRPAERHPGNARLRLQLREKDELTLVGLARLQHILHKQGPDRGVCGASLGGDGVDLFLHRRDDLLVDGGSQRVTVRFRGPPPQ